MSYIQVESLTKDFVTYKKSENKLINFLHPQKSIVHAVDNVNFSIKKGESIGFIGANGAGKSTTIKMLTGILTPTTGTVSVDGLCPYKKRRGYVKKIGVVFGQRSQLWWDLPVEDSFKLLKKVYSIDNKTYQENINKFSEILSLDSIINKPVRQLSLGQRMRCEIAASFLHNPEIVFLDEPTIGLDLIAKDNIRDFIKLINKEKKVTVILTSHDMSDIENICDRLIIIDKGTIVFEGGIHEIGDFHGKKRVVSVEMENSIKISDSRITLLEDEGKIKKLEIDLNVISLQEALNILSEKTEIMDMKISGTPIEDIIKQIYTKSAQNK